MSKPIAVASSTSLSPAKGFSGELRGSTVRDLETAWLKLLCLIVPDSMIESLNALVRLCAAEGGQRELALETLVARIATAQEESMGVIWNMPIDKFVALLVRPSVQKKKRTRNWTAKDAEKYVRCYLLAAVNRGDSPSIRAVENETGIPRSTICNTEAWKVLGRDARKRVIPHSGMTKSLATDPTTPEDLATD